jgi:bifunctional UDP-N-acetylglucosamine pyrophosphorylase/glucosamine-1-phosphate N-acetyltransferase
MKTACVILAAGLGTRMNSELPKVLHRICGMPMIRYVLDTAGKLRPDKTVVVAGKHLGAMRDALAQAGLSFALQEKPKGTGHALRCASRELKGFKGDIVVMNGDTPLLEPDTIKKFLALHRKNGNSLSVLSFSTAFPAGYGRIVRDASGNVLSIVEEKDAGEDVKLIKEVNSGVYAVNNIALSLLDRIKKNRAKGEYYLTDIVALASGKGLKTSAYCIGTEEDFMGVNTREELNRASLLMRQKIVTALIRTGVNVLDPRSVHIHSGVSVDKDTTIYPNVYLEGNTVIGKGSTIFPNVRILDSRIGSCVVILDSTVIEGSVIRDRASVGPFARIRPGSEVGVEARIGNFVELKKSVIGKGTKASHLSYLGDTSIGNEVNIGAGTITCNYDGRQKHLTTIEDGVFIGSDSQLIAPVKVGKGAYIGAGSTITMDVPPGALAISRAEQRNIKDWAKKRVKTGRNKSGGKKGKEK